MSSAASSSSAERTPEVRRRSAAVAVVLALAACAETPQDVPIPNRPPVVTIAAGPIRDSVDVFIATFNWNASDTDGQVRRFLIAVDDTLSPDAWFVTDAYEATLMFTAPDSAGVDHLVLGPSGVWLDRYRFRGAHTFFLKAVDDDGAESAPAALSFTAETIAPETEILVPSPSVLVTLGPTFAVSWRGTDLDGTEDPVAYSHRLVPVADVLRLAPAEMESVLFDPLSPGDGWSPFERRLRVELRDLAIPVDYLFGVRALDQAGAIEPRLRSAAAPGPTNILRIRARENGGQPVLVVASAVKSAVFPTADERRKTFQVPAATNITFTWRADASEYGGRIAGYSYGLDLTDLDFANPGWSPESAALTRTVLRFNLPPGARTEEHILYVRARDDVGTALIADITLVVVPLSQERDVLYVDDFGDDYTGRVDADCSPTPPPELWNQTSDWPADQCHDQFMMDAVRGALAAAGHPGWIVDRYEPLDPRSGDATLREMEIDSTSAPYWIYRGQVTLANLARYKLVVWNLRSEETSQLRHMNKEGEDNFLAAYIEAGGDLWLAGTGTFSRTRREPGAVGVGIFGFASDDFLYRFLKLESVREGPECTNGCFRNGGVTVTSQRLNGFDGAVASITAQNEGFPALRVARPPYTTAIKGVPSCEGMVVPLGLDVSGQLALLGGRLDTLYFYQSNARLQLTPPGRSYLDDAACAFRYAGPGQGRMLVCGFPLYFLAPADVSALSAAAVRWLLAE
jgi:hypothetical protein